MKKNLGKAIILLVLFWGVVSQASTYRWDLELSKKEAYTNEAIYFQYKCRFSDKSELYVIEFNPVTQNENYTIKLLSESEKIVDNKRENSFGFVLFVKKGGEFSLEPKALMKKTNRDSIENTVLGRDNRSYEEYSIKELTLPKIDISIKESRSQLVGNFALELHKDQNEVKAYEPYHMEIVIKGRGDFNALKEFNFALEGVKIFKEKPLKEIKLTENGYEGVWSQKFAFVSDHDFVLPAQKLSYFDLKEKEIKELSYETQKIVVKQNSFTPQELLDQPSGNRFVFKREYLYYLLVFIFGVIVGKLPWGKKRSSTKGKTPFCEKLSKATSLKQLSVLLILEDELKYQDLLQKIENKELRSVKEVLKLICD